MDKNEAITIARAYIDLIGNKYEIKETFLFGSYAKGTNHQDSDIDIAVIVRDNVDIIDTQIELMKLRRKIDLRIEPHPFKEADFNRTNPVANEILKYGIAIEANIFAQSYS